ncbi:Peptidyl-prolyl cis-trans isomerase [Mycena sanguinolenta]|uniref:peptidylprolyl isomerase n=1 Tax=Mycena sanguinolenta TaxID=230812 RepID=A0A8H6XQC3_9AGAR|nr:Peptidyl-prolyl cis-trans isomerase [Mycena sanguinolenta]
MPKKAAASEKKSTDKKGKGKSSGEDAEDKSTSKGLKAATAVRHILCEKHSKATEALEKIKEGQAFNKVAQEYSEDKAKGESSFSKGDGISTEAFA